jgi:hypothetical protein
VQEMTADARTGEVTIRDLTPSEIAMLQPDPSVALAEWRSNASCSNAQGILALGETKWNTLLEYSLGASWAEKMVIEDTSDWWRMSQDTAYLGYALNLTDTEMDDVFILASTI